MLLGFFVKVTHFYNFLFGFFSKTRARGGVECRKGCQGIPINLHMLNLRPNLITEAYHRVLHVPIIRYLKATYDLNLIQSLSFHSNGRSPDSTPRLLRPSARKFSNPMISTNTLSSLRRNSTPQSATSPSTTPPPSPQPPNPTINRITTT